MCAIGEHNWKRSDPNAYFCAYRVTVFYDTDHDYDEQLLELKKFWKQTAGADMDALPRNRFIRFSLCLHRRDLPGRTARLWAVISWLSYHQPVVESR